MLFSIYRIFLMLGPECNLQCKYCLQHDMASTSSKQISQKVIHWIKTQVRSQSSKFTITFYGGEPLIYWDAIQQTIREIGDVVSFSIITNGKLLDEEKVNYLNDHNVHVAVSWDGKNVMETRGYDVLKNNPNIPYINNLSISAVSSKANYPKDFLDSLEPFMQTYYEIHHSYPGLNIDTIMDFGHCADLADMDCDKIYQQMQEIVATDNRIYHLFKRDLIRRATLYFPHDTDRAACGNGISVWNVDTDGNIYRCHNCGEKIGSIDDDPVNALIRAVRKDPTEENFKICKECPVVSLCGGGCPLVNQADRERYYCKIKRSYYLPLIEYANRKNEAGKEIVIQ